MHGITTAERGDEDDLKAGYIGPLEAGCPVSLVIGTPWQNPSANRPHPFESSLPGGLPSLSPANAHSVGSGDYEAFVLVFAREHHSTSIP